MLIGCVSNVLGVPKQLCSLEGSQASPVHHSGKSNTQMKTGRERWWNDTDRGN